MHLFYVKFLLYIYFRFIAADDDDFFSDSFPYKGDIIFNFDLGILRFNFLLLNLETSVLK